MLFLHQKIIFTVNFIEKYKKQRIFTINMIDKTDKKILRQLKLDSRQSLKEISEKTKIRPSTIHARIQKLLENKVIENFTIKTNDKELKEDFIVFILINSNEEIPNVFFKKSCIKDVFGITGSYDLVMKCKFKDIVEFNEFILELRKQKEVKDTVTMVSTIKIKEEL